MKYKKLKDFGKANVRGDTILQTQRNNYLIGKFECSWERQLFIFYFRYPWFNKMIMRIEKAISAIMPGT